MIEAIDLMRDHEYRTNASNSQTILAIQTLVDGIRDDYRDQMYGVADLLNELQQIRQRLNDADEPNAPRNRDLERALTNTEQILIALMLFRLVRTTDVSQHLEEIQGELRAIREQMEPTVESGPEPELQTRAKVANNSAESG